MHVIDTALPEVKRIVLDVFADARGYFSERYSAEKFAALHLPTEFIQDNFARSAPGVIRGLHFQHTPMQGKLVGVTRGRVLDVAVDVRPSSPTFGQHITAELSDENHELLWIPAGFAHGYCVLGDQPADMIYKTTAPYGPQGESGIRFDDATLAIDWPTKNPILSPRDAALPTFKDAQADLARWFA